MAAGYLWALILGCGGFWRPESPKWVFRHGKEEEEAEARATMARVLGVTPAHYLVSEGMTRMRSELDAETSPSSSSSSPLPRSRKERRKEKAAAWKQQRLPYRILLGMSLQALQQLSGANFFFYYPLHFRRPL